MGLFDVFKDEDKDSDSGGMAEEYRSEDTSSDFQSEPEPAAEETTSLHDMTCQNNNTDPKWESWGIS